MENGTAEVDCPGATDAANALVVKPRHQRQFSDVSNVSLNSTNFTPGRSCMRLCRRSCIDCRQTMWAHKIWMCFTASTWGFLSSVERAVILPTLYLYLKGYWSVDDADKYYGITMAAFSLSILIMTPVYGWASCAGIRVKTLLLLADFLEIVGNLIYLFAGSPLAVLFGRLISGIGASCEPPLYADIVRATNKEERTSYIIILLLTRQIGLIFGPSFTLLMDKMDYRVANFTLSVYNGPGLLMAGLWILHSLIIIFFYPNIDKNGKVVIPDPQSRCYGCCDKHYWFDTSSDLQPIDKQPLHTDSTDLAPCKRSFTNGPAVTLSAYRTYAILTLYLVTFATYYCFMGLEAALPPVANHIFGWSEVETSYVYLAASFLIIFVVVVLRLLNSCFSDRVFLLFGLVVMVIAYSWLTIVLFLIADIPNKAAIPLVLIGIAIHVIALPFSFAYCESLYTKLAPIADMDRAQSIFRTVINVAFLVGPYVGGTFIYSPTLVFFNMTVISLVPTLCIIFRFNEFNSPERPSIPQPDEATKEC